MSKIEEFEKWAKQFIAIQDSHVREFIDFIGDLSLHEMKCKFSEQYQEEIAFSYSVQVERKSNKDTEGRVVFYYILQKKEIVQNLHIKKIESKENCLNHNGFSSWCYINGSGCGDSSENPSDFENLQPVYDGSSWCHQLRYDSYGYGGGSTQGQGYGHGYDSYGYNSLNGSGCECFPENPPF